MIQRRTTNISKRGQPVEIRLDSPYIVVTDPILLVKLAHLFAELPPSSECDPSEVLLGILARSHMRMFFGCYKVTDFEPGLYGFDVADIVSASDERPEGAEGSLAFIDVETASMAAVDYDHLPAFSGMMTWEDYKDAMLTEVGDTRLFDEVAERLGGPYFAVIMSPGIASPYEFKGDGTYTLVPGAVHRVDED